MKRVAASVASLTNSIGSNLSNYGFSRKPVAVTIPQAKTTLPEPNLRAITEEEIKALRVEKYQLIFP